MRRYCPKCYGNTLCAECDAESEARQAREDERAYMLVHSQHINHRFRAGNQDLALLMLQLREQVSQSDIRT